MTPVSERFKEHFGTKLSWRIRTQVFFVMRRSEGQKERGTLKIRTPRRKRHILDNVRTKVILRTRTFLAVGGYN